MQPPKYTKIRHPQIPHPKIPNPIIIQIQYLQLTKSKPHNTVQPSTRYIIIPYPINTDIT